MVAALLLTLTCPQIAVAELPELIIRNALISQPDSPGDPRSVDIHISHGLIADVSEDRLQAVDGVQVEDAEDGYVLGSLTIGLPPRFVIVDENPFENIEVFQDTAAHTIFSVNGEEIVSNTLKIPPEPAFHGRKFHGWISHNPPPVLNDSPDPSPGKWNEFDTRFVNGQLSIGLFLDRAVWLSQNEASRNQPGVGDLEDYDGGTIRAFRFGLNGEIKFARPWHYSLWVATNSFDSEYTPGESDDIKWIDYRLDIPLADRLTFSIGKQKEPISLPRLMTLTWNPMQERTAAENAMMPSRNIGMSLNGHGFNERVTWAGGVFNDWIESGESFSDNARQYVGRVTWLPMISPDERNLVHLGLGIRYDDTRQGLRYQAVPEVKEAPLFVDTGFFDADSSTIINLEASWRNGPLWIMGEFTRNDIDAPSLGNPTFDGYHIAGSWSIAGGTRPYNRPAGLFGPLPIKRDIHHGGRGALELTMRWSEIDLTDSAIEGGEMQVARTGATWWAHPGFNVSLNYQKIWNDWYGSEGKADSIVLRFMLFNQ